MRPSRRGLLFGALTAAIALGLAAAGAELALRLAGYEPWAPLPLPPGQPVIFQPDPVLGWRHREGDYLFPAFSPRGQAVRMRFLADGSRATGAAPGAGEGRVLLVGGSFTEGFAVSDEETFAWKLQQRFPSLRFANHGTGAYGTHQSLLLLEQLLAQGEPPVLVIYGFMEGHDIRNVATAEWTRMLAQTARRHQAVAVPHADLDGQGAVVRRPAAAYPLWPLRERSAALAFLQHAWASFAARSRSAARQTVTEQLLLEMHALCQRHGTRLLVALLYASDARRLRTAQWLAAHGIELVDCSHPLTAGFYVPGDGHPNDRLHSVWAACIARGLRPRLQGRAPPTAPPTARPASSRP